MLSNGAGIVVGLSGGADSVALLEVLCEKREALGLRLAAVHVHHGIRPEAQQDAEFCRELCARKQVDFFCEYVDQLVFEDEIDCRDLFDGGDARERIVVFAMYHL